MDYYITYISPELNKVTETRLQVTGQSFFFFLATNKIQLQWLSQASSETCDASCCSQTSRGRCNTLVTSLRDLANAYDWLVSLRLM